MSSTNDEKTIYTDDKEPIRWMEKDLSNHLDKTTLIFGASGSGKTFIINEILYLLKDHIPNYIVIAPRTSDMSYREKLPARCIKEDLTKEKLQQIWDRQVFVTQVYNIANKLENLRSVYNLCPDREVSLLIETAKRTANDLIKKIEQSTSLDFGEKKAQKTQIEELLTKRSKNMYRDTIRKNAHHLIKNPDLTLEQKITIEYLDLNPRICIILDDCSEKFEMWMKMFGKREVNPFSSIFYRGRWNFITLIFAVHDDTIVDPKLRKNARVTIYTTSQALVTSVERKATGFTPKEKKLAMKLAARVFCDEDSKIKLHQKLCYLRDDSHPFRYTIANCYPDFDLGCHGLRTITEKMPKKDDNIQDNPYIKQMVKKKKDKFTY